MNSNIPKNRSNRCISNELWFLFRKTKTESINDLNNKSVFPNPVERKSIQNISINNFQLNWPNSIIEIN